MPLYAVQNTEYEYYKYGTEPNATVVGSPTNENGVISGFTTANYLKFPQEFKPESKTWEMLWKVTTGSSLTASNWSAGIFGEPTNNKYGVWLSIDSSGHLRLIVGTGNGTQSGTSATTLAKVTTYYIKAYYTGIQYFVDYSTDNVTFENIIIIDYATPMAFTSGNVQMIGQSHYGGAIGGSGHSGAWLGSIDLNECYIKIDDKMWWNGTKGVLSTKDDYDYRVLKVKNYTTQNVQHDYYSEWIQPLNPTGITVTSGWTNVMNAFDGYSSTYATCGTATDYIEYDLGRDVNVGGFSATCDYINSTARACNMAIFSVDKDGNETLLANGTGAKQTAPYTTLATFIPVTVSKLRFKLINSTEGTPPTTQYPTRVVQINVQSVPKKLTQEEYFKQDNKYIYYKYGTEPNATIMGSPTIEEGVVSNFVVSSNYLVIPEPMDVSGGQSWEVGCKVVYKKSTSSYGVILGKNQNSGYQSFLGFRNSDLCTRMRLSNNNSSETIVVAGQTQLEEGKVYWIKYEFTGSVYNIYLSTNGIDYVLDGTSNNATSYTQRLQNIGSVYDTGNNERHAFGGSLDLKETYIKIDGKMWWNGTKGIVSTEDDYDYKVVQTPYYKIPKVKNYTVQNTRYKYKCDTAWTQPVLTENGTLGGDTFAVYCPSDEAAQYTAKNAFDNNSSTFAVTHMADFIIYNPSPLNITNISHTIRENYKFNGGAIYGSNDNEIWEEIVTLPSSLNWDLSSNTKYYKYYKITQTVSADWQPIQFTITATKEPVPYRVPIRQNNLMKG